MVSELVETNYKMDDVKMVEILDIGQQPVNL